MDILVLRNPYDMNLRKTTVSYSSYYGYYGKEGKIYE